MIRILRKPLLLGALAVGLAMPTWAAEKHIVLATTTSVENSGLLDYLLPKFKAKTGIVVRVVAQGTGKALRTASMGDADLVMVHHPRSEEKFIAEGGGIERVKLMYNRFLIVGPVSDPAHIGQATNAAEALKMVANFGHAEQRIRFVSRGDSSGTHRKEQELWTGTGVDLAASSGIWYLETGSGMGTTLNITAELNAYTLSDRGTWLAFNNKRDLQPLFEDDPGFFNQYSIILVNPERHPHVKQTEAMALIDWLASEEGQTAIDSFRINGEQGFFANAETDKKAGS